MTRGSNSMRPEQYSAVALGIAFRNSVKARRVGGHSIGTVR